MSSSILWRSSVMTDGSFRDEDRFGKTIFLPRGADRHRISSKSGTFCELRVGRAPRASGHVARRHFSSNRGAVFVQLAHAPEPRNGSCWLRLALAARPGDAVVRQPRPGDIAVRNGG